MTTSKPTQREMFVRTLAIVTSSDAPDAPACAEFLAGRITALDRKRSAKAAPKPETLAARAAVLTVVADADAPMTATEIAAAIDATVQRTTAALTALVKSGTITRVQDGKQVTFTV